MTSGQVPADAGHPHQVLLIPVEAVGVEAVHGHEVQLQVDILGLALAGRRRILVGEDQRHLHR